MITQFKGESRKETIINNLGLDVEEEDAFFQFIIDMGYSINDSDEIIESLYIMFTNN